MSLDDTIAAIATPQGEGGIGIVRVSGSQAIQIAHQLFRPSRHIQLNEIESHTLTHGYVIDTTASNEVIDEVLLGVMRTPRTYTTEDIVEFNCHGGSIILSIVLDLVVRAGARLAEPGEFTKRAFLNGRLDLTQAEAVAELINAKTELSRKVAIDALSGKLSDNVNDLSDRVAALLAEIEASIDFPDEDLDFMKVDTQLNTALAIQENLKHLLDTFSEGRIIKEGVKIAILGKPNVGKSTLFNELVTTARAIVTDIPGTTRDTIEESINIGDLCINLVDTAGIRQTDDIVEQQGVQRSRDVLKKAELLLLVFDASDPLNEADMELLEIAKSHRAILILNKTDLPIITRPRDLSVHCPKACIVKTAMTEGKGIDDLKNVICDTILGKDFVLSESPIVTNTRHHDALLRSQEALNDVLSSLENSMPPDLVSVDLRIALDALGEIVGKTTTEDILDRIFLQFCVGK